MADTVFQSNLSIDEIEENFKNTDSFTGIMDGLQEAVAYKNGRPSADTISRKRSLPTVNVAELRLSLDLTQKSFAKILGVSPRTVEAWESGKTTPSPTAKKLMFLIQQDPSIAQKL